MSIYSVFVPVDLPPRSADAVEGAVVVRDKFSFLAFVVPLVWLLWHRAWLALGLFLLVTVGLSLIVTQVLGFDGESVAMLELVIGLYIGFAAPDIQAHTLQRRGFALADIVVAHSEDEALMRFAERWSGDVYTPRISARVDQMSAPPPMVPSAAQAPVIGLFPEAGR